MTEKECKDFCWVSWRICLEAVISFSAFYLFVFWVDLGRYKPGIVIFFKTIVYFTSDKADWVVVCFYVTWIFHWFYFWVRMREHIYKSIAEKYFWGSVIFLGILILMYLIAMVIDKDSYNRFLNTVLWPSLKFCMCGSFPILLGVNIYFGIEHYASKAPWADPPYPYFGKKTVLTRILERLSFYPVIPPKKLMRMGIYGQFPPKKDPIILKEPEPPPPPKEEKVLL